MSEPVPRSELSTVPWPPLPTPLGARYLALLYQLDQSQWWPPQELERMQFVQLGQLLAHAARRVPFYRQMLRGAGFQRGDPVTRELWGRLPILTRREVQEAGSELHATIVPAEHGGVHDDEAAGPTGTPVKLRKTDLWLFYGRTISLRRNDWGGLDPTGKLAVIRRDRSGKPVTVQGQVSENWGSPTADVFDTGTQATLDEDLDLSVQAEWLRAQRPDYLLARPAVARALAGHFAASRSAPARLAVVVTFGEPVDDELRELVRAAWGARLYDGYGAPEVGTIALPCPEHARHHLQAEGNYVEIIGEDGRRCGPGEIGRVIVTPLHNFAMPLIRYDIGDQAEVGEACPCGRGLPTIRRVPGRALGG